MNSFIISKKVYLSILFLICFKLCFAQSYRTELWGTCSRGGSFDKGLLFKYASQDNKFTKVREFNLEASGYYPNAPLLASGSVFYSTTPFGGNSNDGILFTYNYSANTYQKILDFEYDSRGSYPTGRLFRDGSANLFGTCQIGGKFNQGTLYQFNTVSGIFTKKVDFKLDSIGSGPIGGLVRANNGKLYGVTSFGGKNNAGVLFEFDMATGLLNPKAHFDATSGRFPNGGLLAAGNGKLYGLTRSGGLFDQGTLYEYNIGDTLVKVKVDFNGGDRGGEPMASLIEYSPGNLIGLCNAGGQNGLGNFFLYNYNLEDFLPLLSLSQQNGITPNSNLSLDPKGKIYGMMNEGGSSNNGVVFSYDVQQNSYTKLIDFTGPNGALPQTSGISYVLIPCTPVTKNLSYILCSGDEVVVNQKSYSKAGNYRDTLYSSTAQCDSILNINITVNNRDTIVENIASCDSFLWQGTTYRNTGSYSKVFTNQKGCDSLRVLNLVVHKSLLQEIDITTCDSLVWEGMTLTSSGVFTKKLNTQFGCDSTRVLYLTLLKSSKRAKVDTAYACQSYTWRNKTFTQAGVYFDTLINAAGCDSLIQLDLYLTTLNLEVKQRGDTLISQENNANYQWIDCDKDQFVQGAIKKVFVPATKGNYQVLLIKSNCLYRSNCLNTNFNSIEETKQHFGIFPNPNQGTFSIILPSNERIEIYNQVGQLVHSVAANHQENLEIQGLKAGLYYIKVNGYQTQKVVVLDN